MLFNNSVLSLVSIVGLVSFAIAGLVGDEVLNEWTRMYYGKVDQYAFPSAKRLLALTSSDQLVCINTDKNDSLLWRQHEIGFEPERNLFVTNDGRYAYLFSHKSKEIRLYETGHGGLMRTYSLGAFPLKLVEFSGRGVLTLLDDKQLVFLGAKGEVTSLDINNVKDLKASQTGERLLVLTNEMQHYIISSNLEVISDYSLKRDISNLDQVSQLYEDVIITSKNKIYKIFEQGILEVKGEERLLGRIKILNKDLFYASSSGFISFFRLHETHLENLGKISVDLSLRELPLKNLSNSSAVLMASDRDFVLYDLSNLITEGIDGVSAINYSFIKHQLKEEEYLLFRDLNGFHVVSYSRWDGELVDNFYIKETLKSNRITIGTFQPTLGLHILVDEPPTEGFVREFHEVLVEQATSDSFLKTLIARFKRNISHLTNSIVGKFTKSVKYVNEDLAKQFGMAKLLLFYDLSRKSLVAVRCANGNIVWSTFIDHKNQEFIDLVKKDKDKIFVVFTHSTSLVSLFDGKLTDLKSFKQSIEKVMSFGRESDLTLSLKFKNSDNLYFLDDKAINMSGTYLVGHDKYLVGYKLVGTALQKTWEFERPSEQLLAIKGKDLNSQVSSVGVSLADKSVLYKYLYPNWLALITRHVDSNEVKLYVLDSVTGSVLYMHTHDDEVIDLNSINMVVNDNWISYSYLVKYPRVEQRIVVLDLFEGKERRHHESNRLSSFEDDILEINTISKKSFIYPERIVSLASTYTRYGITQKALIALTASGDLVEIPKTLVNGRRTMGNSTGEDLAYDPIIPHFTYKVLNTMQPLLLNEKANEILIRHAELESTDVVCFANEFNHFCTEISPSFSFDVLSKHFDKQKLIWTLIILLIAHFSTKYFVTSRRLKATWIDQ